MSNKIIELQKNQRRKNNLQNFPRKLFGRRQKTERTLEEEMHKRKRRISTETPPPPKGRKGAQVNH